MLIFSWFLLSPQEKPEQIETIIKSHILKRQNFTLPDLKGQPQAFSQWNDKVVLLNFWAALVPAMPP